MNIISVKSITSHYGDSLIHDNISFDVEQNRIFAILGGSGSGKSTLLKNMLLLHKPTSGEINILNHNIWNLNHQQRSKFLEQCGVMFQFGALFSSMSVIDNVGIRLSENSAYNPSDIEEISMMWLKLVGLSPKIAHMKPSELSGGMTKRASLARALALSPKILFLDEPTSGLDPYSAEKFDDLILTLKDILDITIVMVTHDLDSIKDAVDNFILLENKKIIYSGDLKGLNTLKLQTELFSNTRGKRYLI